MRVPTIPMTPLAGAAINDMILELMALSGERRRAEMAQFLENGRSTQSDIMTSALRGMILRASA